MHIVDEARSYSDANRAWIYKHQDKQQPKSTWKKNPIDTLRELQEIKKHEVQFESKIVRNSNAKCKQHFD